MQWVFFSCVSVCFVLMLCVWWKTLCVLLFQQLEGSCEMILWAMTSCKVHDVYSVCMCVRVTLSDLPPGLYGPNQMVGNINFTILSPPPPPLSSYYPSAPSSPLLLSSPRSPEMWLRSSSEHHWSEGFSVCVVCLVTAWWSEQLNTAYCVAQFMDDVSRWMLPFTNTASPLAAALAALLLPFLLLWGKKKKKQLKRDKNKQEHKWFTSKIKKEQQEGVWSRASSVHTLYLHVLMWLKLHLRHTFQDGISFWLILQLTRFPHKHRRFGKK